MNFYELFIAWRYMYSNIKQTLIIVLAISLGVSVIIWVPSINLSFFNDLIDKSVSSAPHISVTKEIETFDRDADVIKHDISKNIILLDQTRTRKRNILSVKRVEDQMRSVKGIVNTAPYTSGQAFIIRGADERGVSIKGIIPSREVNVVDIKNDMIRGNIEDMGINDVVIGDMLADKLNVDIGDRVTVTGPRGDTKNLKITINRQVRCHLIRWLLPLWHVEQVFLF